MELLLVSARRGRHESLGRFVSNLLPHSRSFSLADLTLLRSDATLTDLGVQQALAAKSAFTTQAAAGLPLPQSLYSSPMRRAASTLQLTWDDLLISKGVTPIIKEHLR